jgi:carbamoylphosphate synthase large subunit
LYLKDRWDTIQAVQGGAIRVTIVHSVKEGIEALQQVPFPIRLSSAFSLQWHRTAKDKKEFGQLLREGLDLSPIQEVRLEHAAPDYQCS